MVACLVQQLFRQKITVEIDQGLIEEVLFPMLRSRKHWPKELLQDIKLTSDTLIITDHARREARHFRVPTFTPIPEYWTYVAPWHVGDVSERKAGAYPPVGQRTSKVLRKNIRNDDWGTIDILNKLRELNYPEVGYKPTPYAIEEPDSFDDAYIRLAEDNSLPENIRGGVDHSPQRIFVKNFLDYILITDKRLTWWRKAGVLSIEESSQHGEVQTQLY
jgi:hypothetical protein